MSTDELLKGVGHPFRGLIERGIDDWKGHFENSASRNVENPYFKEDFTRHFKSNLWDWKELIKGSVVGEKLETPIPFEHMDRFSCPVCGENILFGFDGESLCVLGDPCPYPDGLSTTWELNVPSGRLVVENDLRFWYRFDQNGPSINYAYGRHIQTLEAAASGLAYGSVGNSCPKVYKDGDKYTIASWYPKDEEYLGDEEYVEEDEEDDDDDFIYEDPDSPFGKKVASICTDLWWYSIADFDDFERRRKHYNPSENVRLNPIVDVKPGVYRFTHDQMRGDPINGDEGTLYATFEWVRDPDPVRDLLQIESETHLTATEVLLARINPENWESLSPEEKTRRFALEATYVFSSMGSWPEKWHENGFLRQKVSEEVRDLAAKFGEIPLFNNRITRWNDFGNYSFMKLAAEGKIPLNPSFARLALNICRNVIKFGAGTFPRDEITSTPKIRQAMRESVERYRAIRAQYPEVILDPEFDEFMKSPLDEYIDKLDCSELVKSS